MKRHGFSLAEALITLLIISITIAALAPTITTRRNAALNPNLYWATSSGGVVASGSLNNTLFGIGATPSSDAHLTVGSGRANSRYALKIVGSHNPILNIDGNTTTSGDFDSEGNITTKETIMGGTLSSEGTITAKGDITSSTGEIKGKLEHIANVSYLTTDATCPAYWQAGETIQVCTEVTATGCTTLTLLKCVYKGS